MGGWHGFCPTCGDFGTHERMPSEDVFVCNMCRCGFKAAIIYAYVKNEQLVAQSGSAPALGAGGPGFESRRADQPTKKPRNRKKRKSVGDSKWMRVMRASPCHYCGGKGGTIDHKQPVATGGKTSKENCVPCCEPCNRAKGSHYSYSEFKGGAWRKRRFAGSKMALGGVQTNT